MPRGFMLYVSAAAVGLLGFGQPVPAEASDASHASAMTTTGHDTAATQATASVISEASSSIVSSISSTTSTNPSSPTASISPTASSISVTMTPSSSPISTPSSSGLILFDTETCQSKTINYITHTLPQQCLRTSWSSANATSTITDSGSAAGTNASSDAAPSETAVSAAENATETNSKDVEKEKEKEDDENQEDLATGSFMSFEEWKVLQLKKAGQDPVELQARRRQQQQQHPAGQHPHGAGGDINIDSIGDDGEIALDFDVLNEKVSEMAGSASAQAPGQYYEGGGYRQDGSASGDSGNTASSGGGSGSGGQDDAVVYADGATQYYRSKDAGKTSKERFSFASFDAGATILKTNKGVKNAKAILVENKDSYMLLECRTRDKHVIVEMSDDILVDTVVLANFEFFSSMVRRFRVSVSDRYPVKADRWRVLGEYEARNSRDIQPFLIEHPQIWAKYIRIDFLTHYGSEYYCPISLLRVHGTRMLDSWKDSENGRDGEDDEELEQESYQHQQSEQQQQAEQQEQEQQQQQQQEQVQAKTSQHEEPAEVTKTMDQAMACNPAGYTPWNPIAAYFRIFVADTVCLPSAAPAGYADDSIIDTHATVSAASQNVQPTQDAAEAKDGNSSKSASQSSHSSVAAASSSSSPTSAKQTQSADKSASPSSHTQSGANDAPSSSPSPSSSTSSNASSSSDASSPSQSSASSASPSAAAAKNAEQDAAAAPPSGKSKSASSQKVPASPGTHGNQQAPPTTTVQTSHTKNRAGSSGSGGAGSSSQASTGGSGSNPGATPGGGSSSSVGNSNSGGGSASGTVNTPSPPPPPIVQESFFKSITKRLQLLESNTSLSLQYIEDQSRFLQEALRKMERKQISRVDSFLDTLNNTVLSELRNMRQQYDQIWQSTVIALETQREQNQRETVALSDRLNVLADEVVFQKRMAILQSVLLLCCLALVIFSRGLLSGGSASVPLDVNAAAAVAAAAGYMPMPGLAMSPSPSSPPSASSSVGIRSNLRSLRNNLRNPYAAYSVYASGYPLSAYSAGSPPPPSNPRSQSMPVNGNGNNGNATVRAPVNMNKVLPLTPTTPTSPGSPGLPESPELLPSNESQDSLLDADSRNRLQVVQEKGQGPPLAAPKPLTPPTSLRLSDIEEAADQMEDEDGADSNEDSDDATILSEATTVRPDGSKAGDGNDDLRLFTPRAASPTLPVVAEGDAPLSSAAAFASGSTATVQPQESLATRKRLPSLPEHNSD
ncbi:hypothetical protein SEUCBS140593_008903 [Sporothrix eucalyptigena]|uniref:SUN domain-containing protein n=1 Tax=Sporothrix eucalyptigena TaxID=1812306 RepID=A0ABP0CSM9_9PEZI